MCWPSSLLMPLAKRILSDSIARWTNRLRVLRSREADAQTRYDKGLIKSVLPESMKEIQRTDGDHIFRLGFAKWTDKCLEHGDMYALAESFVAVSLEGMSRVFSTVMVAVQC